MQDTSSTAGKVEFLKQAAEALREVKEDSYRLMQLRPGQRVLDVGCGPATDTIHLAHIVGPSGQVIGIDVDPAMIDLAVQKAESAGVSGYVQHQLIDAAQMPFADNSFDSCRCERVFEHLDDPEPVLSEMLRVTKSGGRIVLNSGDYPAGSIVDTRFVDLMWRMRRFRVDQLVTNGYAADQFYRRLRERGCEVEIHIYPHTHTSYDTFRYANHNDRLEQDAIAAGLMTEAEVKQFDAEQRQRDAEGTFFASGAMLTAVGQKP